jgi:hypothetical protein
MPLKPGDKIVAHTRLAVENAGKITLFEPGAIITIGPVVAAAKAQDWLDRGSAGPFVPAPTV